MKVSIIISTYNRAQYIGITIDSFLKLDFPKKEYEIIIVDNNSSDNTQEIIDGFIQNPEGVSVIYHHEKRQGVHYAKNTGAKISCGDILYFTDDDMIADPALLKEILKAFDFDSRVATVTGKVLPKWEVPPPEWIKKHCTNHYLSLMDLDEEFMVTKDIKYLYTCHYAIKRNVFFEADGFNPEIFGRKVFGDGETGLTIKTRRMGHLFGYTSKSVIFHMIPPSRMTQKYLNRRIGVSSANTNAYTSYRRNPSKGRLVLKTGLLFIKAPLHLLQLVGKSGYRKDSAYLRFALAFLIYYYNTAIFNYKLFTDPFFQKIALKSDWLSNDNEFDVIRILKAI